MLFIFSFPVSKLSFKPIGSFSTVSLITLVTAKRTMLNNGNNQNTSFFPDTNGHTFIVCHCYHIVVVLRYIFIM